MKQTVEQRSQKLVKSTINKIISNVSVIAIFVALGVIMLCYAGLTFNITAKLVITVAVPSIILAISSIIIYELWVKNGIANAKSEKEYIELLDEYDKKSKDLNSDVMQEFIEAEKQRRYEVEEKKLQTEIERIEKIIMHINNQETKSKIDKLRLRWNNNKLANLHKLKDSITVDMPYTYSEQLDQLRYNAGSVHCKEYKPNDTAHYMRNKRINKYTVLISTTLIGFNAITPAIGGQHWLIALFMTVLSAIALISSLVSGFSHGYASISVSSVGVYKTALSFIEKAEAYCKKYNKSLRNTEIIEIDDIPKDIKSTNEPIINDVAEIEKSNSEITKDIFDNLLK